jgi:hypothetical protein
MLLRSDVFIEYSRFASVPLRTAHACLFARFCGSTVLWFRSMVMPLRAASGRVGRHPAPLDTQGWAVANPSLVAHASTSRWFAPRFDRTFPRGVWWVVGAKQSCFACTLWRDTSRLSWRGMAATRGIASLRCSFVLMFWFRSSVVLFVCTPFWFAVS